MKKSLSDWALMLIWCLRSLWHAQDIRTRQNSIDREYASGVFVNNAKINWSKSKKKGSPMKCAQLMGMLGYVRCACMRLWASSENEREREIEWASEYTMCDIRVADSWVQSGDATTTVTTTAKTTTTPTTTARDTSNTGNNIRENKDKLSWIKTPIIKFYSQFNSDAFHCR